MNDSFLTPPPFEIAVECGGETHWVEVIDGVPRARAHDVESERALEILGGDARPCVRYCQMVGQAPNTLSLIERIQLELPPKIEAMDRVPERIWWPSAAILTRAAKEHDEPLVEPDEIPAIFRRLAILSVERKGSEETLLERVEKLSRKYAACTFDHGPIAIRFEIGELPGVSVTEGLHATVVLSRDWLPTVFLFGMEAIEGRLTLGATLRGDGMAIVTQAVQKGDLVVGAEERILPLPDGIRLLSKTRA